MDLEQKRQLSQKMELLGRLAAGVVHDFNNLLTVILGAGTMLQDRLGAGDPLGGLVDQIYQAASKGAALTSQLLAFSRHQPIQPSLIQLNQVLTKLDPLLRHLVGKQVTLVVGAAADLGLIHADASQVDQIIMNLALNARDAMPAGGKLLIETADVDIASSALAMGHIPPGSYVTLTVRDNGSGMSAETIARLFEPFFTTKKNGRGTGLGLATVYSIMQRWGGHIAVASELGRGSSFTTFFPRVDAKSAGQLSA